MYVQLESHIHSFRLGKRVLHHVKCSQEVGCVDDSQFLITRQVCFTSLQKCSQDIQHIVSMSHSLTIETVHHVATRIQKKKDSTY